MAITTAFTIRAKYDFLTGVHASGNNYRIALFTDAVTLNSATTQYASTNEVAGANGYTQAGQTLATYTCTIDTSTAYIDWSGDPAWPTSTISARGCMIYNNTDTNKGAIGVWDFGATISSSNGTFTVTFPAPAAATALIRIA
jgi:hypothetical protein